MQRDNIVLDSYAMFKPEDGYFNMTMLDIPLVTDAMTAAMEAGGYSVYGVNRTKEDGHVTLTFVTHAHRAELTERHHASCRNSLGGIIPDELKQIIGKMAELGKGTVAVETYYKTTVIPFEEQKQ